MRPLRNNYCVKPNGLLHCTSRVSPDFVRQELAGGFQKSGQWVRCLLEAECRTNDCRGLIEIADWQLKLLSNKIIAVRCLRKTANIADSEEVFFAFGGSFHRLGI